MTSVSAVSRAVRCTHLLVVALGIVIWSSLLSASAMAQSLPLLPGSGGDVAQEDVTSDAPAALSPREQLIEILKDDAAREALIRDLEAGVAAPDTGSSPQPQAEDPALASDAAAPEESADTGASGLLKNVASEANTQLQGFWSRAKRVPGTIALAFRAFEQDVLLNSLRELAVIIICVYVSLLVLRLITAVFRRRIAVRALEAGWLRTVILRGVATALDLITIPLALVGGVAALFLITGMSGELSDTQAIFVGAFLAVEVARATGRFVLSPRSPELRVISLPPEGVASLWLLLRLLIYLLGFGQLLIVPIIDAGISVFVGRAVATVLGAISVLILIYYTLSHRRPVAAWLHDPEKTGFLHRAVGGAADRWHWPVLAYLVYVLTVVLTRPGNVLLPLLWATLLSVVVVILGLMAMTAISRAMDERVRISPALAQRLPMLEERLNGLVPAVLVLLRAVITIAVIATILDVLDFVDVGAMLTSSIGIDLSSRLVTVLIIALVVAALWLAISSWVDYRLNPFAGTPPTPREITLLTLMRNAITIALVIIGLMFSLSELGMNIGPLIASAGVLGLAISFGAQKLVEDIITGIFIQFENAMNVGDVVDVGGVVGTVERLTVRSVTLRDLHGVVHMIPFSSASMISNYMREFSYFVADIGVAYREEIEEVQQVMLDAFEKLRTDEEHGPFILADLEWFGLNSFGPSEVVVRARIKTAPGKQWGIGRAYNLIIKQMFDAQGIEIPFPHQTIYFGADKAGLAPAVHVNVDDTSADQPRAPEQQDPVSPAPLPADPSGPGIPDSDDP